MPFDTRIWELCWELENCYDDTRTIVILTELQELIHERVEQIRGEADGLDLIHPTGARRFRGSPVE